jgi:hypothetical protein
VTDRIREDFDGARVIVALVALPGAGGTSLARSLGQMGISVLADSAHAVGTQSVESYGDRILARGQSTWSTPPEYLRQWDADPDIAQLAREQVQSLRRAAADVPGDRGSVWFDERLVLLVDLWRRAGAAIDSTILLWGTPEDAVEELRGSGIARWHARALWEHALVHALAVLSGSPVFVCSRAELSEPASPAASELLSFLSGRGVGGADQGRRAEFDLSAGMARTESDPTDGLAMTLDHLAGLGGAHDSFPSLDELALSGVSEELLAAHRAALRHALGARDAWKMAERRERDAARAELELDRAMTGVDSLSNHLLNAMGVADTHDVMP